MPQVRHKQGSGRGFLLVKSAEGKVIAMGDLVTIARGNEVHSRLTFHFRDGSVDDDTTVFRQGSVFQLLTDHHIQKGPSFPDPIDLLVDVPAGQITTRTMKDGKLEVKTEQMQLPPDLANGIMPAVLESFPANAAEMKVSYVAGTPKARVVTLAVKPDGKEDFKVAGVRRESLRYNIHIELGGVAGVVAPVLGKQPSDTEVWVATGEVPSFLKLQGAFYLKGPIWTMELASPSW